MKLIPRRSQVIGRIVMKRVLSTIVRPDETKGTTKFILIDAVGADAEAAGLRVGDVVLPLKMGNITLDGGVYFRPILDEKDIAAVVQGANLNEFVVQNDSGSALVPYGDKDAATSLGAS